MKVSELFRKYPKTPVFDHSNYRLFERITAVPGTSNNRGLTVFCLLILGPKHIVNCHTVSLPSFVADKRLFFCVVVILNVQSTPFSASYWLDLYVDCISTMHNSYYNQLILNYRNSGPSHQALARWVAGLSKM